MKRGAIVLCGGKSSRMGYPKAMLPFGEERMLQRVVRLVAEVVPTEQIVVVAAPGQELPLLPTGIQLAADDRQNRGPLEGLAAGLQAIAGQVDVAYATSCDVPLLQPAFIEQMFQLIGEQDIAIPKEDRFHHPLAACYRTTVLDPIRELLAADRLRPFFLLEKVNSIEVPIDELRSADPELASLSNLNTPEDYLAALRAAGLTVSPEWKAHSGESLSDKD